MTWVFFVSFPFTHLLIIYSLLGQMSTTHTLSPSHVMAKNPIQATCNEVHEDLRGIPLESSDTGTCLTDFCLKSSSEAAIFHPNPTATGGKARTFQESQDRQGTTDLRTCWSAGAVCWATAAGDQNQNFNVAIVTSNFDHLFPKLFAFGHCGLKRISAFRVLKTRNPVCKRKWLVWKWEIHPSKDYLSYGQWW